MNRPTFIVSLLIVAGTLILMGTTYAYFTAIGTSDEQTAQSGVLELTYETGYDISLNNVFPCEESEAGIHQFAIENTGTLDATYYLYLDNIVLQKNGEDTQSENLKWKLYSADENYTQQSEIISGSFKDKNSIIELDAELAIRPGEKHYYILKIWLQELGEPQNEDQGLTFSAQVEATTEKKAVNKTLVDTIKTEAVLDNIASTYVTSSSGIDFSKISSDTNGKGLYILHGTENDPNPIMYYRGAVGNNNVKFANFCWKIVRTTETGGVKLIYNGIPDENDQCNSSTTITGANFNSYISDNAYVGYMYGKAGASSYNETHGNVNNSEVKTTIDNWYSENMINYTDKLEDTIWCNDRSYYSGTGIGKTQTMYNTWARLTAGKSPSLECKNVNDCFTVSTDNGNGALTYPIALLTADEIVYAGGVFDLNNTSYYLNNGGYWWTLSPFTFYSTSAGGYMVSNTGRLEDCNVNHSFGTRPAISLKAGTTAISGDGTSSNPYVIE